MIWGKTQDQVQAEREPLKSWHKYFAWTPVTLIDGRTAWLSYVARRLKVKQFRSLGYSFEYAQTFDHRLQ